MDWKIIAVLVVAVAIVVSGFVASGGIDFILSSNPSGSSGSADTNPQGDFLAGAKNAVSNILYGTASEKNINRTLQFSGTLSLEPYALMLNTPASSIMLEFDAPSSMNVGSESIDIPAGTNVSIGKFTGKLDVYSNNTVAIDGNAETFYASSIGILPHAQKTVSVKTATTVKSIEIYNTSADSLNFRATGSIDAVQGNIAVKLNSEPIQIQNFKGDMHISGASLALDGFSTSILAAGEDKISIG